MNYNLQDIGKIQISTNGPKSGDCTVTNWGWGTFRHGFAMTEPKWLARFAASQGPDLEE